MKFNPLTGQLDRVGGAAGGAGGMDLGSAQTVTGEKKFNAGALLDKGNEVFNVKAYGAVGDGTTNDTAAFTDALAAINAAGRGTLYVPNSSASYVITSGLALPSNCQVRSNGATLSTSMLGSAHRGIFTISNKVNIVIDGLVFNVSSNVGGSSSAITSYGHDGLTIKNCKFTGNTDAFGGLINLDGEFGASNMLNTTIKNCDFYDATGVPSCIHLYPRNAYTLNKVKITGCTFKNTRGPAVVLDAYALLKNVVVTDCQFDDLSYGGTTTTPGIAVFTRLNTTDLMFNVTITNNQYRNTLTTALHQQGFVYYYGVSTLR